MVKKAPRRRSSLSQERSQHSRSALIDAAEELWADGDVDEVRVEDICDRAGVSKGLFYFYFGTKEDLLVELLLTDADAVAATVESAVEDDQDTDAVIDRAVASMARRAQRRPRHVLARGVAEWFAALERHDDLAEGHAPLESTFAEVFARGQERGEVGDGHSAQEIGEVLARELLHAALEWATAARRQPSLPRRLASRAELIMRGAAAE